MKILYHNHYSLSSEFRAATLFEPPKTFHYRPLPEPIIDVNCEPETDILHELFRMAHRGLFCHFEITFKDGSEVYLLENNVLTPVSGTVDLASVIEGSKSAAWAKNYISKRTKPVIYYDFSTTPAAICWSDSDRTGDFEMTFKSENIVRFSALPPAMRPLLFDCIAQCHKQSRQTWRKNAYYLLLTKENQAYLRQPDGSSIPCVGWIDVEQVYNGGDFQCDPAWRNKYK